MSHERRKKPGPADGPEETPTGGRLGPRGGRHVSQERYREQVRTADADPGPLWDDVIRAIEDDCTPVE